MLRCNAQHQLGNFPVVANGRKKLPPIGQVTTLKDGIDCRRSPGPGVQVPVFHASLQKRLSKQAAEPLADPLSHLPIVPFARQSLVIW